MIGQSQPVDAKVKFTNLTEQDYVNNPRLAKLRDALKEAWAVQAKIKAEFDTTIYMILQEAGRTCPEGHKLVSSWNYGRYGYAYAKAEPSRGASKGAALPVSEHGKVAA